MRILLVTVIALIAVHCSNKSNEQKPTAEFNTNAVQNKVLTIASLLNRAPGLVNSEVTVRGTVTHTCKHSGKRWFIVGDDQKTTLRVEAKGEIGGFNRELTGSELAITGKLRERKLSKEYIDQYEEQVKEQEAKEGSAESCQSEKMNIQNMREWMKKNNKDYFSTYFMDGESYEVLENE